MLHEFPPKYSKPFQTFSNLFKLFEGFWLWVFQKFGLFGSHWSKSPLLVNLMTCKLQMSSHHSSLNLMKRPVPEVSLPSLSSNAKPKHPSCTPPLLVPFFQEGGKNKKTLVSTGKLHRDFRLCLCSIRSCFRCARA